MTALDTKALRALHEAATPGPWRAWQSLSGARGVSRADASYSHHDMEAQIALTPGDGSNAAIIVAMRNQLPALLDRIAKLEAVAKAAAVVQDARIRLVHRDATAENAFDALAALETP